RPPPPSPVVPLRSRRLLRVAHLVEQVFDPKLRLAQDLPRRAQVPDAFLEELQRDVQLEVLAFERFDDRLQPFEPRLEPALLPRAFRHPRPPRPGRGPPPRPGTRHSHPRPGA